MSVLIGTYYYPRHEPRDYFVEDVDFDNMVILEIAKNNSSRLDAEKAVRERLFSMLAKELNHGDADIRK